MRSSTGHVPRYLDWFDGLCSKVKRPYFERLLFHISPANIKEDPVRLFVAQEPLREKGFIAANYLEYFCDGAKFQSIVTSPVFDMLVEFTPVMMKFGVVPCRYLRDRCGDLNPKIVYVVSSFPTLEHIEPDVMDKIIEEFDEIVKNYSAKKSAGHQKVVEHGRKRKILDFGEGSKTFERRSKRTNDASQPSFSLGLGLTQTQSSPEVEEPNDVDEGHETGENEVGEDEGRDQEEDRDADEESDEDEDHEEDEGSNEEEDSDLEGDRDVKGDGDDATKGSEKEEQSVDEGIIVEGCEKEGNDGDKEDRDVQSEEAEEADPVDLEITVEQAGEGDQHVVEEERGKDGEERESDEETETVLRPPSPFSYVDVGTQPPHNLESTAEEVFFFLTI